jgi:2-oxoglutarate dehydrogenase E1 component
MGPEHSSARLERFLALAAEDNIQVVYPTTPAQYFHCLRRQALRRWRKPLIVMTPKSLLRHPRCVSDVEELSGGGFQRIISNSHTQGGIKRILLCSGKIFYELAEAREKLGRRDTAILRVEQLYPLPDEVLHAALAPYPDGVPAIWVQEEPENMGAWRHLRARFGERLLGRLPFHGVCRPASASPATGSLSSHKLEQGRVIMKAFGDAHA